MFLKIYLFIVVIFCAISSFGQESLFQKIFNDFDSNYSNGNIKNLYDLAPLLNIDDSIFDPLGYHLMFSKVEDVARRKIKENTLFYGISIDSITQNRTNWEAFLSKNNIKYSSIADVYLNQPLDSFHYEYRIKKKTSITEPNFIENKSLDENALKKFQAKKTDFKEEVDYWGHILLELRSREDIEVYSQILEELIATKSPKALFYIGTELYRDRNKYDSYNLISPHYFRELSKVIDVTIEVKDEEGNFTPFIGEDDYYNEKAKNFLLYWNSHYKDYVWDSSQGIFTYVKNDKTEVSDIETHFKNLSSKDSKIAISALKQILLEPISKVNEQLEVYRFDHFGDSQPNDILPSFLTKRIRALNKWIHFLNEENIEYKISAKVKAEVEKLEKTEDRVTLFSLEDNLIRTLSFEEITQLEFFISLRNHNLGDPEALNNSFARIFDYFYRNHREEILDNNMLLRNFLKKAQIFDAYGIIGSNNNYLDILRPSVEGRRMQLINLLNQEEDVDIKHSLEELLQVVKLNGKYIRKNDYYFRLLQMDDTDSITKAVSKINSLYTKPYAKYSHYNFSSYSSKSLIKSNSLALTIKEIIEIERAYGKYFKIDSLYKYFAMQLELKDTLSLLDFNRVYGFKRHPETENIKIEHLQKAQDTKTINEIDFNSFSLNYYEKLSKIDSKEDAFFLLIDRLILETVTEKFISSNMQAGFASEDPAEYFNRLINYTGFLEWVNYKNFRIPEDDKKQIILILNNELNKTEKGSFDYESLKKAVLKFTWCNLTIKQKIENTLTLQDAKIKNALKMYFMHKTKKKELAEVFQILIEKDSQFSKFEKRTILNDGHGIVINKYDPSYLETVLNEYKRKGRKAFLKDQLIAIYPDLFTKRTINYAKVHEILSFDDVLGFIGGQGSDRNDTVKLLIRYLEEVYDTNLCFQYNLEYLDNHIVTGLKYRRYAWILYLKERGLINHEVKFVSISDND